MNMAAAKSSSKTTAIKTIESGLAQGGQSATFREILELDGFRIRLTVTSDSYAFQSRATSEVWSKAELRWNQVHYIPHGNMRTASGLAYGRNVGRVDFRADLDELLAKTKAIIL